MTTPNLKLSRSQLPEHALKALLGVEGYLRECGLERGLIHLVKLLASNRNRCAYCVDMHTKDARAAGETEQRLYAVPVWRETPFFTPRERAALAYAEAVTRIGDAGVPDDVYAEAREHFDDAALVALTMAIITINGWNRLSVSFRTEVGGYQPAAAKG